LIKRRIHETFCSAAKRKEKDLNNPQKHTADGCGKFPDIWISPAFDHLKPAVGSRDTLNDGGGRDLYNLRGNNPLSVCTRAKRKRDCDFDVSVFKEFNLRHFSVLPSRTYSACFEFDFEFVLQDDSFLD